MHHTIAASPRTPAARALLGGRRVAARARQRAREVGVVLGVARADALRRRRGRAQGGTPRRRAQRPACFPERSRNLLGTAFRRTWCRVRRWSGTTMRGGTGSSSGSRWRRALEAEHGFLYPNQRSRGRVFSCIRPHSAVSAPSSKYSTQHRLPAPMSVCSQHVGAERAAATLSRREARSSRD